LAGSVFSDTAIGVAVRSTACNKWLSSTLWPIF